MGNEGYEARDIYSPRWQHLEASAWPESLPSRGQGVCDTAPVVCIPMAGHHGASARPWVVEVLEGGGDDSVDRQRAAACDICV